MSTTVESLVATKWQETVVQLSGKQQGPTALTDFTQVGLLSAPETRSLRQAWDIAVNVLQPRPLGQSLAASALSRQPFFYWRFTEYRSPGRTRLRAHSLREDDPVINRPFRSCVSPLSIAPTTGFCL